MEQPRLVVSDIEGCIIPGGHRDWDLEPLAALRDYNRQAAEGKLPPMTICSGRPAQYVEAVAQACGIHLPMVCENGSVWYDPATGHHHPLYTTAQQHEMLRVRNLVRERFGSLVRIAEGKDICVSIVPQGSDQLPGLLGQVTGLLRANSLGDLTVARSSSAVDITPPGISKATGLAHILALLGVSWDGVLGVGDGGNDLPFLARAGRTATPHNGLGVVQSRVEYVAGCEFGWGLVEILERFTGWQRTSQNME